MLKIEFDVNAGAQKLWEGPYPSRAALEAACSLPAAAASEFAQWKVELGLPATQTHIFTPFFNAHHMNRRYQNLRQQCDQYAAGGDPLAVPGLNFSLSPDLKMAFAAIAAQQPAVRILGLEATRETVMIALQKERPDTKLEATLFCISPEDAQTRNDIVRQAGCPELSELLRYTADWRETRADIVFLNSFLEYLSEPALHATIRDIAAADARYLVLCNTLSHNHEGEEWMLQRYGGGGMASRTTGEQELTSLMKAAGYKMTGRSDTPPTYNINPLHPVRTTNFATETQFLFEPR